MIEAKIRRHYAEEYKDQSHGLTPTQRKKLESEFAEISAMSDHHPYVQALSTETRSADSISQHLAALNLPEEIQNKIDSKDFDFVIMDIFHLNTT